MSIQSSTANGSNAGRSILIKHRSLAAIGLCACLLISCADKTTDLEHLARAKQAQDQGDVRTSVIELKNALQKNPDNAEARRLLGEINASQGNGAAAEKELLRAIQLGVSPDAVMVSLAEALQLQHKYQDILDKIDIPNSLPPHIQAVLAAYRGDAWMGLGKPEKARVEYAESLRLDPDSPRGKLGLAYLAAAKNDTSKALHLLEEALDTNSQEPRIWRFKASLHKRRGELELAEESYSKVIALRQHNQTDFADRTLVRIELGKFDQAAKDIQQLKKTAAKLYLTHFAEGYLHIAQGRFAEAREPLEQAIRLNERYPLSYYYLGLVNLNQNELEQADHNLSRFKSLVPNSARAHKMLALVKFRQKDYRAAKNLLRPVILSQPNDILSLNLMAAVAFESGDSSEGLKYLQKVSELAPESTSAKAHLGMGKIIAGLQKEGIKSLEALLAANPSLVQPGMMLAKIYIRDHEYEKAGKVIDRLKAQRPNDPHALDLEAEMLAAQGDVDKARTILQQILVKSPGNPDAAINLARMAVREQQFDQARQLYQEVLTAHPNHQAATLGLAELDLAEGRFKEAEERLTRLIQAHPTAIQPRLFLGRHYLRFGQPERCLTLLDEIHPRYPQHPALLELILEAQLAAKQNQLALGTVKELQKAAQSSAQAQYLIARAYAANGDSKNMRAALDRTLKNDPDFLPARLTLVKVLLDHDKQPKQARNQLEQLIREYPGNPAVLELQGWWALQQNQPLKATESFRAAFIKRPSSRLVLNLSNALWQANRRQDAITILEHWNAKFPKDAKAHYLRASLYKSMDRKQDTLDALTKVLEIAPRNPRALNDMAWLLRQQDPQRALEYAEQAYAEAPKAPPVIDTLAMVLLENQQPERALSLLEKAVALAPQNPSLRYHLAILQHKTGQDQKAASNLESILKPQSSFPERKEAEKLLVSLNHQAKQP